MPGRQHWRKRAAGTFGDVAVFSFQINKNMTCGEGGCVVTSDLNLHERAFACHDTGTCATREGPRDVRRSVTLSMGTWLPPG